MMNWAVWPGRYPPGDPAGGPGQKKRRGVELSTYPGVSALCVALRAQAMATWQSPHSRFRPGFPHAAALHPGQTNLARVGAALPFGVPFTGAAVPGPGPGAAVKRPARSTYWIPQPRARRSASGLRANGPSVDNVMRHLLARLAAARLSGVTRHQARWIPSWFPTGRCGIPEVGWGSRRPECW